MSPKEKADELYWKFYQLVADCSHPEEKAKECALIAVIEIINSNPHSNPFNTEPFSTMDYWVNVKKEIEKL